MGVSFLEVCVLWRESVISLNSLAPLLSDLVDFLSLSGLVIVLVLLASLGVLLSSTTFGSELKLLISIDNGDVVGMITVMLLGLQ